MRFTLAPDEFGSVERGNDVKEERGAAFHSLEHQVSDRPDVDTTHFAREMSIVHTEHDQEADDGPERNLTDDVIDAQTGEREKLPKRCSETENLSYAGECTSDERAHRPRLFCIAQSVFGGASALRSGRQRLHRHR